MDPLSTTRSTKNWSSLPGNFDRLNTRALYPSSNDLGIPDLPVTRAIPTRLIAYNARSVLERLAQQHQSSSDYVYGVDDVPCVHFFLDDYRFETVWSQPTRSIARIAHAGMALTPDFSLWREMPLVMQQWQTYRARWCGRWMIDHGIKVIPTVSWSTPASYDFAFLGIGEGSTVAISTVGAKSAGTLFDQGLEAMIDIVKPSNIVVYGGIHPALKEQLITSVNVIYYPARTRWSK